MARSPAKNGKQSVMQATSLIFPSKTLLVGKDGKGGLADLQRVQQQRAKSASGVYRSKVGDAVEEERLDAQAWAMALRLHNLDDKTLHVRFFHFMYYLEVLGIEKRATAQEEMFDAGDVAPKVKANGKGHAKDDGKEPTSIGTTAREVAEKAGARLHSDG